MIKVDLQTAKWAVRTALLVFACSAGVMALAWLPWPQFSDVETQLVLRAILALISLVGGIASLLILIARGLHFLTATSRH